jgi:hypothetical protein
VGGNGQYHSLPPVEACATGKERPGGVILGTAPGTQGTQTRMMIEAYGIRLMDCREFREKHVGFVDDILPAIEMEEMNRHLQTCLRCSRHDTAVRRGLLIVRNLPRIEPSPDFMARLNERLEELQRVAVRTEMASPYRLTTGSFATLAAGLALIGYVALEAMSRFASPTALTLPPVVATAPETRTSPLTNPAYIAGISTGMPIWPAVMMVEQAPRHLADVELQQAALR